MIRYSYQLNDFRQWLNQFSELFHVPVTRRTLTIPPERGEGSAYAALLPEGFSCAVLNFSLFDDLQLISEATTLPGLCLFFTRTIVLSSTGHQQETLFPQNSRLKGVALYFPPSFLQRHVRKDILSDLFQNAEEHPASGYTEPISFECRQLQEEIYGADPLSPLYHLRLLNRARLLAEKFLSSFLSRSGHMLPEGKIRAKGREKDLEALKGIVHILSDRQLNKFPSIEALSKTAMMSSTKLKSRFKQTYGMKLYEFYNRHRLEQAREMLRTGNFSVKQVGVNIGFSNLSNFAKAFKKEFGVLPREVLKNR